MDVRQIRELIRGGASIQQLPLRVVFYARVSTEREEQASSLENQVAYYTGFIKSNPGWIFVGGYIDEGISGASVANRESFKRMIQDAKRGRFDYIITKEISRFSRNTVDSIRFTQELLHYNVGVLFQNDGINTFESDGELRLTIMSGLAQDELRRLSERVRFGQKQSIKDGKVLGGGRLYGYAKKDCKLTVIEEEAETVRLIFELYANQGLGLRKISQVLYERGITGGRGNPFNTRTMSNMFNNPKYKGYYCGNKTSTIDYRTKKQIHLPESEWVCYKDESIPAIVPEELWDRAHALLCSRGGQLRSSGADFHKRYAYSGKLICGKHGTSYQRQIRASGKEVWVCRIYREKGAAACGAPFLHTAALDKIMADIFQRVQRDKDEIIERLLKVIADSPDRRNYQRDAERVKAEIASLEKKKEKLLELSVEQAVSNQEFKKRNDSFNQKLEQCRERLNLIQEEREKKDAAGGFDKIRAALNDELSFRNGADSELAASILGKIIVWDTGGRNSASLEIRLINGEAVRLRNVCPRTGKLLTSVPRV